MGGRTGERTESIYQLEGLPRKDKQQGGGEFIQKLKIWFRRSFGLKKGGLQIPGKKTIKLGGILVETTYHQQKST